MIGWMRFWTDAKRVRIVFALNRGRLGASVGAENRVSMVDILDH